MHVVSKFEMLPALLAIGCALTFLFWNGGNSALAQAVSTQSESIINTGFRDFGPRRNVSGNWWFDPMPLGYREEPSLSATWDSGTSVKLWSSARFGYELDRRINFTGVESTFGVAGAILGRVDHRIDEWDMALTGELYLNQPFDRNILVDYALRESFSHNFDVDTLELSQLFLSFGKNEWAIDVGKFVTPFGRYFVPLQTNNRVDAPFIRTESILFRETGIQFRWEPSRWRFAVAATNGGANRDTNSSKALIARLGIEEQNWVAGISVKAQDGIGSEAQKEFKRHAGFDVAYRNARWVFSSEFIYDQYGLRRPGTALDEIDWGRSIYNRQLNNGLNNPLEGWGWHANAMRTGDRFTTVIGYGEFYPVGIGDAIHDQTTRRLLIKLIWPLNRKLDFRSTAIVENQVENAQDGRTRDGVYLRSAFQYNF